MTRKTGIVYHSIYLEHETGTHVERKERLQAIIDSLRQLGLWQIFSWLQPERAQNSELKLIHSAQYIAKLEQLAQRGGGWWDADTIVAPGSVEAARVAVGGSIKAVDAVMSKEVDNALALVRPPGHHAESDTAMGFCLFNNIALAAQWAIEKYCLKKIAIIDWDVHHGNGTQKAFWQRDDVLYLSGHRSPLFPGTGAVSEVGCNAGEGFTVNVPLPRYSGDMSYYYLFKKLFEPVILEYRPELILVSAGYDAHFSDPLGGMLLTAEGFCKLTRLVLDWAEKTCDGRLVMVLEGGYHLEGLTSSVLLTLKELAALELDLREESSPERREFPALSQEAVDTAIEKQAKYWPL